MKKIILTFLTLLLTFACILCLVSCNQTDSDKNNESNGDVTASGTVEQGDNKVNATGLWKNARYLSDVTIGDGAKTISFEIEAEGQKITVTLKTDKDNLGDAMYEVGLVNDPSFFDTLNGIKADWNKDKAYWGFYKGEEYMTVGIGDAGLNTNSYRFVYTK
ncbi:MAG: hypothetical protein E7649_01655 [Ruminococcaceae bacterium]|nr:hypothetical protein [Oscillospiraceae bacterium]